MNKLYMLDVTLRDGGCVNDFNFGYEDMASILKAQEMSGVEYIEMGYIDEKKGSSFGRTQYINEQVIPQSILKSKKENIKYVAMIDYGKFDINNLRPRTQDGIDGLRIAFHKKNYKDIVAVGKTVMEKGYEFFAQPMITLRYSDFELLQLIELVNKELVGTAGFYIVDTFGEMHPNDVNRLVNLVDNNLNSEIRLGFHSHNNLQMSYANAIALLQFPTNRDMMLDCSIMGMGKGAGNLNTELILGYLNHHYGKNYNISPLLAVIDNVLMQIRSEFYWGYSIEYFLSSANHCTPSYASYFYEKHMLPIDQVNELLNRLPEEKRISFDRDFAEQLYREYNEEKPQDDTETVSVFTKLMAGKKAFLIAPGSSITLFRNVIENILRADDTVSFSLNHQELFDTDYIMTTRAEVYNELVKTERRVLASSNIVKNKKKNTYILNYKKWITIDQNGTWDSSSVILINFLRACGVKHFILAGFDGFVLNINDNYYEHGLRQSMNERQVNLRNDFYTKFFKEISKSAVVEYITPSLYSGE